MKIFKFLVTLLLAFAVSTCWATDVQVAFVDEVRAVEDTRTMEEYFDCAFLLTPSMEYIDVTEEIKDEGVSTLFGTGDFRLYLGKATKFWGFNFEYFGGTSPTPGERMYVSYWEGCDWEAADIVDGTYLDMYDATCKQSGPVGWCPISDWEKTCIEGHYYYWVEVDFTDTVGALITKITPRC